MLKKPPVPLGEFEFEDVDNICYSTSVRRKESLIEIPLLVTHSSTLNSRTDYDYESIYDLSSPTGGQGAGPITIPDAS
jgi:hypothetical protein